MDLSDSAFPDEWQTDDPSPADVRLAAALAQRLDAVVPQPFSVRADGGYVILSEAGSWCLSAGAHLGVDQEIEPEETDPRWTFSGRAAGVAWSALSTVQDVIARSTTEPWPQLPQGGQANPGTRTDGQRVFLWYGPDHKREDGAVLTLPPILLSELNPSDD